jgi:hypothetical protein
VMYKTILNVLTLCVKKNRYIDETILSSLSL